MSDILKSLRTWVEIDLDALESNLENVKKNLPEKTKILAVVKANAYGHGAVKVSSFLQDKVDYLAVASTDEALEIRKNKVDCPILILGHIPHGDYKFAVKYNLTVTVSDFKEAKLLSKAAVKRGTVAKMHLAVDTGMSRIGFALDESSIDEIEEIKNLPNIEIEGLFSHFAAADTQDKAYTNMQIKAFDDFSVRLKRIGVNPPIKHMYNSAAIADLDFAYDMVRQGIILYGLNPSDEVEYKNIKKPKPVMAMKTHIVQVKEVEPGVSISYGCTYKTLKKTRVATLCAGYADGVPRFLSNNGGVLIKGKYAPIIGRVCMDQFMVDVTDIPEVETGDTATIFGGDGDKYISVDDIAAGIGTIGYELVCNINSRVTRVYMKNGEVESAFCYLPHK